MKEANAASTFRFQRLITRLVLRDASHRMVWFLGVLALLQGFIAKYVPPSVIREAIQTASSHRRSIFLVIVCLLYAWGARPLVRTLIGSHRLTYLRHLPLHPRSWMWAHLRHLVLLNLPWFGIAAYGLFGGRHRGEWFVALSWWLTWCTLTLALQLSAYTLAPRRGHRRWLLLWLGLPLGLYALFVSAFGWGLAVLCGAAGLVFFWLHQPPPVQERVVRSWLPQLRLPALVWLRLEWLTLVRRCMPALIGRLGVQAFLAGMCALAIYNNKLVAPGTLLHLSLAMALPIALIGASVSAVVLEERTPLAWWDEQLGLSDLQLATARWGLGLLCALPTFVWLVCALKLPSTSLPWSHWGLLCAGILLASLWATLLCATLAWNAQLDQKLHEGILWGLIGHGFPVLLGTIWFPSWFALWCAAPALFYMIRGLRSLRKQRLLTRIFPPPRASSLEHTG